MSADDHLIVDQVVPKKRWFGTWPAKCDFCKCDLSKEPRFIDGHTIYGPWALMCEKCHCDFGCGLGTGRGQMYDSETREKLEGQETEKKVNMGFKCKTCGFIQFFNTSVTRKDIEEQISRDVFRCDCDSRFSEHFGKKHEHICVID